MNSPYEAEIELLKRRLERERSARKQAELLLETKSRELYDNAVELKSANAQLRRLAYQDPVTGLPNRRVLEKKLSSGFRAAALYLIDLNDYNFVASTLGHTAGNELLKEVAKRLTEVVGSSGVIARIGGDEFAIFQENCDDSTIGTSQIAASIVEKLAKPYVILGNSVYCSASCGVSIKTSIDNQTADRWFTEAEIALGEAKTHNRGSYLLFDEELREVELQRLVSREEICCALDSNQFEVWLQPQVNLKSEQLVGYESLARWNHPRRGTVGPGEFIPTIEHMGLASRFGAHILESSFSILKQMQKNHVQQVKLGINLTAGQLLFGEIYDTIRNMLIQYDLAGEFIELEITEGSLLNESKQVQETLHKLRQLGITIALDDFGTGFSSLSYLRTLPIDRLKIDRSFVQAIPKDVQACGVIIAIIQMAKALELEVIAEGIETNEQANLLRCLGVEVGQGFLFSQPIPPDEILFQPSYNTWLDKIIAS